MNKRLSFMVSFAVAVCCLGQVPKAEDDVAVNVKVSLADGSQLQGTLHTSSLALVTGFGKKEIPLAQIATLDFAKDGVKVNFRNRDVLSGKLEGSAFVLRTIFNDVKLDSSQVKSIQFLGGGNAPRGGKEPGLLLHVQLDSANENLGTFNAYMETKDVHVIEGPSGNNALLLETEDSTVNILLPFSPWMMPEGTIEFWAKIPQPHRRFGNGGVHPMFVSIECPEVNYFAGHFIFGFSLNDGTGRGGLIARIHGMAVVGTHSFGETSSVAGTRLLGDTPDGWHHYSLVWKRDGFEFPEVKEKTFLLAVDGNTVASNDSSYYRNSFVDPKETEGKAIHFVIHGKSGENPPLAMSDLKIWDHAKLPDVQRRPE